MSVTPTEICGYFVERELKPSATYLVTAPGNRQLVLKKLDDDCLFQGQLHPSVRDRLGRVRELAHSGIANLYGVERDGATTWLVWEYVAGIPWSELDLSAQPPPSTETAVALTGAGTRDCLLLARELVLNVQMLHARGIVHGAIQASNVIQHGQRVMLTHISPYLWSDPRDDAEAVIALLDEMLGQENAQAHPLKQMLTAALQSASPLDTLLADLTVKIDTHGGESTAKGHRHTHLLSRGVTVLAAVGIAAVAAFAGWGLWQYLTGISPAPISPPQAPPAMMQTSFCPIRVLEHR